MIDALLFTSSAILLLLAWMLALSTANRFGAGDRDGGVVGVVFTSLVVFCVVVAGYAGCVA